MDTKYLQNILNRQKWHLFFVSLCLTVLDCLNAFTQLILKIDSTASLNKTMLQQFLKYLLLYWLQIHLGNCPILYAYKIMAHKDGGNYIIHTGFHDSDL